MSNARKRRKRGGSIARGAVGLICLVLSGMLCWFSSSALEWVPWHGLMEGSPLGLFMLWIPQSLFGVLYVILLFFRRPIPRIRMILTCVNSLYIPVYYVVGMTNIAGDSFLSAMAVCSFVSFIAFGAAHIAAMVKNTV